LMLADDVFERHGANDGTWPVARLPCGAGGRAFSRATRQGKAQEAPAGAIVRTVQELHLLNIRSAMNSGTDLLGKFYEVFLKYGNGAKEISISILIEISLPGVSSPFTTCSRRIVSVTEPVGAGCGSGHRWQDLDSTTTGCPGRPPRTERRSLRGAR
jgi:hypothetical protein